MKNTNGTKVAALTTSLSIVFSLSLIAPSDTAGARGLGTSKLALPVAATSARAGNTINVKLEGKRFVPTEATVKDGDTIRICNADSIYHSPFRYSKYNQFSKPTRVRLPPGECMERVMRNPTTGNICVAIFDELHSYEKLSLTVEGDKHSTGCTPPNVVGKYTIDLEGYSGELLSIDSQSGDHVSGRYGQNESSLGNTIEADFSGDQCRVLKGKFKNTKYSSEGTFTFNFQCDGGFSGSWSHTDGSRKGDWNGARR